MTRRHAFFLTAAALAACFAPQAAPAAEPTATPPVLGKVIASLPVVATEPTDGKAAGEEIDLTRVKGWKVVYFWSPECPCVRACQKLSLFPLSRAYKDKDVRFFAVAANANNLRAEAGGAPGRPGRVVLVTPGGVGQAPPYPLVLDPRRRAADALRATNTPQAFLLDPQNRVVFAGTPDDSEEVLERTGKAETKTRDYLADALADALAGRPVRLPASPVKGCDIVRSNGFGAVFAPAP